MNIYVYIYIYIYIYIYTYLYIYIYIYRIVQMVKMMTHSIYLKDPAGYLEEGLTSLQMLVAVKLDKLM